MPRKDDADLLAELDSLGADEQAPAPTSKSTKKTNPPANTNDDLGEDALAEIEKQLAAKKAPTSRPTTPRMSSSATSNTTGRSPKRGVDYTPASTSVGSSQRNSSEDRVQAQGKERGSTDGSRSFHQSQTAEAEPAKAAPASSGGGWWGSMYSAATAAVKQAENIATQITGNEEAQKWADQVRGNMKNLQSIGTDLRTRALPTFTSLISHIAPPISAHERLQIHTTHDILNYPSLDPLIYSTFSRVMSQVEGGDLLVLQRGSESRNRSDADTSGYRGAGVLGGAGSGWTDGPWYRESAAARSLGVVQGLKEGTRLVRVSAESYAKEFFDARGGVEEAAKRATETLSESNPVRSSDIFLAIQAVGYTSDATWFAGDAHTEDKKTEEGASEDLVVFAIYLYDPLHSLAFHSLSQPFPAVWASWLDASSTSDDDGSSMNLAGLPESIRELIAAGGVDPRDWAVEWLEETLTLSVGIVAQQYVAKRMGVGEGSLGRGKRNVEEEDLGGEAARAV
ncbi:unnamed protein product [Zymoseptoria tritici ST99CH_3D1]|uniref:Maintenance of telomere capping protein 1 n=2 Tax=Zymoseptoria tritici TaxID=1047171 RepID=A0A1X7RC38_ZYMT9|nr:unnamed protein product [Zymoseptoria tritici ST99CH_3D7]SMR41340.1 unnamed protein product [Zymoseptoria tritici ST99CH_1E4]SMR43542.1 unnamed protein product [Zymoseptoria tritici ST99CH_3D1]